jgi:hypothetical protein
VLFIGTQFSILYTSMYSPAGAASLMRVQGTGFRVQGEGLRVVKGLDLRFRV